MDYYTGESTSRVSNNRVTKICVRKLFNQFNYEIDLDNGEDVSILIAPNGCGKTTIFKILNFIANPTYRAYKEIERVPFESFECALSNGAVVVLMRKDNPKVQERIRDASLRLRSDFIRNTDLRAIRDIDELQDVIDRYEVNNYRNQIVKNTGDLLLYRKAAKPAVWNLSGTIRQYLSHFSPYESEYGNYDIDIPYLDDDDNDEEDSKERAINRAFSEAANEIRNKLINQNMYFTVSFIPADRLSAMSTFADAGRFEFRRTTRDTLDIVKRGTRSMFMRINTQYNTAQRKAKDILPQRYLRAKDTDVMDFELFRKRWESYEDSLVKYHEIGLLPEVAKTIIREDAYKKKGVFLSIYLEEFEKTIESIEAYYKKLKLYVDILNSRNKITRKVFSYSDAGLTVTVDDVRIPLECLSSGEKNDVIMFFSLIFSVKKDSIVLIDEPEISLHIEWQKEYLDYLLEICKINGCQAFVATHSPSIVNGHTELYAKRRMTNDN